MDFLFDLLTAMLYVWGLAKFESIFPPLPEKIASF